MSRLLVLALSLAIGAAAAGCSSDASDVPNETGATTPVETETTPGVSGSDWGSYPADTSLDEREVVEAYVDALNDRDGATFCSVVAPWISGRFDIGGTDPDASLSRLVRCPEFVTGFIGYIEDCCPPEFLGAEVAEVGELDRRGDVVGVPITVTLTRRDSGAGDSAPTYEEPLEDIVWLTRDAEAWRVAKLSLVAAAASLALTTEADFHVPADVGRERRRFAVEVERAEKRRREREASYREVAANASCPGAARYPDGRKDIVDYRHPAPPTPTPQLPGADISAFEVAYADEAICVGFEMGGDIRRNSMFEFSIESPEFDWSRSDTGFAQFFEVELRKDGRARISSGRDLRGHSLSVPGKVGLARNRLRVVVNAASFAAGRPAPMSHSPSRLLARFRFLANVTVLLSERRHLHDSLTENGARLTYAPR